jgi:thiosulfate/3-mercaptopyruvate sulfurtransferase
MGYANPDAVVDPLWLSLHLDDPGLRILSADVGYFADGHIMNALFVDTSDLADPDSSVSNMIGPKEQIEELLERLGVGKDDTIIVYDEGSNLWAGRMYWILSYYGHEDVRLLNGGRRAWKQAGQSLVKETKIPEKAEYSVEMINEDYRVTMDFVLENLDNPDVIILDVRTPAEYEGSDVRAVRGGHIPGALNVDWQLTVNEDGTIKDAEQLKYIYLDAGVMADKKVITYCGSGVRGAHSWVVLNDLLGYPYVTLYDGSWVEWGNDPDVPIVSGREPR